MKAYPSILSQIRTDVPIIAFDKLDGSNIRAEWSKKQKGFFAFGTRKRLISESDELFGAIPNMINESYGDSISKILTDHKIEFATCYFEFYGQNSAFGQHDKNDKHVVTLIDVAPIRVGILDPERFLKLFGHVDHAKVLYSGYATQDFVDNVKNGTLLNMTFEGVVCKSSETEHKKSSVPPIMFKIKSQQWIEKLRQYCLEKNQSFDELL